MEKEYLVGHYSGPILDFKTKQEAEVLLYPNLGLQKENTKSQFRKNKIKNSAASVIWWLSVDSHTKKLGVQCLIRVHALGCRLNPQ